MYKLLIVDDEAIEKEAIMFFINKSGLKFEGIEDAANGKQAVLKTASFIPDIILMDIRMPGMDGIEAAHRIREFNSGCKIIFLTAFNEFEYAQKAVKLKADDFIIKPAKEEVIVDILRKSIAELDDKKQLIIRQKEIEKELDLFTKWYESNILISIAMGYIKEEQINSYFSRMDYKFNLGICTVIRLEHEELLKNKVFSKEKLIERSINLIKNIIDNENFKYLIDSFCNNIYILIVIDKNMENSEAIQWCEGLFKRINVTIREQVHIENCIGIGSIFKNPEDANNSFFQAKIACDNMDNHAVTSYCNIKEDKRQSNYPFKEEKKLCKSIISGDEEEIRLHTEEIMNWIIQFSQSLNEIKEKVNQLIIVIDRTIVRELNLHNLELASFYDKLNYLDSPSEILIYFRNIIKAISKQINSLYNNPSSLLVEKICLYIDENYAKEINLDEICDMVGFSKFYFSKIFKQYKHMNFIDYVTEQRISKAKEYLKNPRLNIKEISNKVGYSDPNYFSSVFKKSEGISPTEFRNMSSH